MTILVSQLPLSTVGPLQLCVPQEKAEKQRPLLAAVGVHCRGGSQSRAAHCSASGTAGDVFHVRHLCVASLSKVLLWAVQGCMASRPASVTQPHWWLMPSQVRTGCRALQCQWSRPMSHQPQLSPGPTVVSPHGLGSWHVSEGLWEARAQCRLTAFPQVALGDVGVFSECCRGD